MCSGQPSCLIRGHPLDLPAVEVTVHRWDLASFGSDTLTATITCSGGTYVRALARDLGRVVSSAAHLKSLRRTRVGKFDVRDAPTLEALAGNPSTVKILRVVADA